VLAQVVPQLPTVHERKPSAILCSGFACQPPVSDPEKLGHMLREVLLAHRVA